MSADDDAREFGQHFNQGGWRLGLLVARNVYMSDGERGRSDLAAGKLGKVTANQFAEKARVSAKTVQLYYRAWQLAAEADECQLAEKLSPGDEDGNVNFEEDDDEMREKWLVYYRKVKASSPTESPEQQPTETESKGSTGRPRTPQARLDVAVKSVEGIDPATAEDLPALVQHLQDTKELLCELIEGLLESISSASSSEPEQLDTTPPAPVDA